MVPKLKNFTVTLENVKDFTRLWYDMPQEGAMN